MSNYPSEIDTDLEIERVDSNITEIGGDAINHIRDAIFAVEKAIGTNPQGNKSTLAARLDVSIDADGNLKQSALSSRGLVSLPITNSQISSTAAIEETKLDLDYTTQSLKNLISSNRSDIDSLVTSVLTLTYRLTQHTSGADEKHDGYDILVNRPTATQYGVAGLSATTVGAAINEVAQILFTGDGATTPHIEGDLSDGVHHRASRVYVDSSNFVNISPVVDDVQEALEDIDRVSALAQVKHVDDYHSNGIYRDINSGTYYNSRKQKITNSSISYSEGGSVVTFSGLSDSVYGLGVRPGDILYIASSASTTQYGTFKIRAVGPVTATEALGGLTSLTSSQIAVFHTFSSTESGITASVYGPASITGENASLACSIKRNSVVTDTVSIMDPGAARVVSLGFNGDIITAPESGDGYELAIEVGLGDNMYRAITIPRLDLDKDGVSSAATVSAASVAERINAYVADVDNGVLTDGVQRHFPITAFRIGNELALAHNLVGSDYTIKVLDGYTGNYALGFDQYGADILDDEIKGNPTDSFSINGNSLEGLATVVSGSVYETGVASTVTTFAVKSGGSVVDLVELGVQAGDVLHVLGHPDPDANGSYLIESVSSTNVTIYTNEAIQTYGGVADFDVIITHSHISLNSLISAIDNSKGLVQIYIDEDGKTWAHQRLIYGTGMGAGVEIVDVNDNFPVGTVTATITLASATTYNFNLNYNSLSGKTVTVPQDFEGSFKVYHPNNIDYITVKVWPGTSIGLTASPVSITVNDPVNSDEMLELAVLHFDGVEDFTNITDKRLFGTIGPKQLRDDFIESYYRRPWSELRSDGVAYGFDLTNVVRNDSITGMQALPVDGGVAYIDGIRVEVETQKVLLPSYSSGVLVTSEVYVVGINDQGTVRAYTDELGEMLHDGYSASSTFGTVLPLYEVTLIDGLISTIVDVRKFINKLDEKVNLIVDQTNNVVGSFRTIEGALRYANNYPSRERLTIQVVNTITPSGAITVPDGVSLIGNAPYGGGVHRIVNNNSLIDEFITLEGNNIISNLAIESSDVDMDGSLVYVNGQNVVVDHCFIGFTDSDSMSGHSENYGVELSSSADGYVEICSNRIINVFSGVVSEYGCDHLQVKDNYIADITDGGAAISNGIKIGTSNRSVFRTDIVGNTISVPSVGSGDIRGIYVDIGETLATVRICNNNIVHEYGNSVKAGVYIDNSSASSSVIEHLLFSGNFIRGVELDAVNTYGLYVDYVESIQVTSNAFLNVGQAQTNNKIINCENNYMKHVVISDNAFDDCNVLYGIDFSNGSGGSVAINNNIFNKIFQETSGTSYYVNCGDNASYFVIDGNSFYGIGATNSVGISSTALGVSCSSNVFYYMRRAIDCSNIAIVGNYIQTSDVSTSIAIRIGSYSIASGNFVNSPGVSSVVFVSGDSTCVSNNYIRNLSDSTTSGIETDDGLSNINIIGNMFEGDFTNIIKSAGIVVNYVIMNNSAYLVTIDPAGYAVNFPSASNIVLFGNIFADSNYTIGSSPTNLVGFNRGLIDTYTIPIGAGAAAYDSSNGPEWYASSSGDAWEVNTSVAGNKVLVIPISGPPNGARIESITVYGTNAGANLKLQAYVRDFSGVTSTPISGPEAVASGAGNFSQDITITSQEVDYSSYGYYLRCTSAAGVTSCEIYGVVLNLRY